MCTATGLPLAWQVETASAAEVPDVPGLLDSLASRGFVAETCALDKGYDAHTIYDGCEARGIRPIVPLRLTGKVVKGEHLPPSCDHDAWTFAGSDARRGAAKYRCPSGECAPGSTWTKADRLRTLMPRGSLRWKALYRGRGAVDGPSVARSTSGAMLPLRVRRIERVRLHVDLTILAQLASALADARAVSLAA